MEKHQSMTEADGCISHQIINFEGSDEEPIEDRYEEGSDNPPVGDAPLHHGSVHVIPDLLGTGNSTSQIGDVLSGENSPIGKTDENQGPIVSEDENSATHVGIATLVDQSLEYYTEHSDDTNTDDDLLTSSHRQYEEGPAQQRILPPAEFNDPMLASATIADIHSELPREMETVEPPRNGDGDPAVEETSNECGSTCSTSAELDKYLSKSGGDWLDVASEGDWMERIRLDPILFNPERLPEEPTCTAESREIFEMTFIDQFPNQRFRYGGSDSVVGNRRCRRVSTVRVKINSPMDEAAMKLEIMASDNEGRKVDKNSLKLAEARSEWKMYGGVLSKPIRNVERGELVIQLPPIHIMRVRASERGDKHGSSSCTYITAKMYVENILKCLCTSNQIFDRKSIEQKKRGPTMEPDRSRVNDCATVTIKDDGLIEVTIAAVDIRGVGLEKPLKGDFIDKKGSILTFKMPHYPIPNGGVAHVNVITQSGHTLCSLKHVFEPDSINGNLVLHRKHHRNWDNYDVDLDRDDSDDEGPSPKSRLRDKLLAKLAMGNQ